MNANAKKTRRKAKVFRVGGMVLVPIGPTKRLARIVEDRGSIGIGGRQLLRIQFVHPKNEDQPAFEIPAEYVKAAPRARQHARSANTRLTKSSK